MKTALKFWSLLFLFSSTVLSGQELQQASFSADQAARGAALYQQNCAACHLANLTGSFEAPNLADTSFRSNWANRRVEEFVDLLQRTMPPQAPGSLDQSQYLDISAFLLEANNIGASATALSLSAGNVLFPTLKPEPPDFSNNALPFRAAQAPSPLPARATQCQKSPPSTRASEPGPAASSP